MSTSKCQVEGIRVAIIGGGPAGLAAAIELAKLPFVDWHLYEQKPAISEIGAGITLQRSIWRLLEKLGASKHLRAGDFFRPSDGHDNQYRDRRSGVIVKQTHPPAHAAPHQAPCRVYRGKLQQALLKEADQDRIGTGAKLANSERLLCGKIRLIFGDAFTSEVDLLMGADGIRSAVISFAFPEHSRFDYFGGTRLHSVIKHGSITLIGDASHPLSGAFGAGAAFALEDAHTLAGALHWAASSTRNLQDALKLFDTVRSPYYSALYHTMDDIAASHEKTSLEAASAEEEIVGRIENVSKPEHNWMLYHDVDQALEDAIPANKEAIGIIGAIMMLFRMTEELQRPNFADGQGATRAQAFRELATASSYVNAGVVAQNVGLLVGALFWGFGADILGRRLAFNLTLWITSVAVVVAGAASNFPFLGAFLALSTFGSGGNLILDPTVLLEFLPGDKQWVVTALAGWWGFGRSITGFVAWGFMTQSRWNCSGSNDCGWSNNAGWRYTMFNCGALVFVLSILRVTVVRLVETPKYLLPAGRDADVVKYYQDQARKYNRHCSLTLEKLESCGQVRLTQSEGKTFILSDIRGHVEGIFVSRKITLSTILIWLSWAITGLAYALFYVFVPAYLSTRVPGKPVSQFETYRNLTLTRISGIPGSLVAGYLISTRLGRKYTMYIGPCQYGSLFWHHWD
ncbi:Sugar (and other) transporter [Fusarium falciforme]